MSTPTWDEVIRHTTDGNRATEEYLRAWIRRLVLDEPENTPYLRLYGPPKSGKSVFANALTLLVPSATEYYYWTGTWNSHLRDVRLAVLEGPNFKKSELLAKMAEYQKPTIEINTMRKPPVTIDNKIRWVECVSPGCDVVPPWNFIFMQLKPVEDSVPAHSIQEILKDELPEFKERLIE